MSSAANGTQAPIGRTSLTGAPLTGFPLPFRFRSFPLLLAPGHLTVLCCSPGQTVSSLNTPHIGLCHLFPVWDPNWCRCYRKSSGTNKRVVLGIGGVRSYKSVILIFSGWSCFPGEEANEKDDRTHWSLWMKEYKVQKKRERSWRYWWRRHWNDCLRPQSRAFHVQITRNIFLLVSQVSVAVLCSPMNLPALSVILQKIGTHIYVCTYTHFSSLQMWKCYQTVTDWIVSPKIHLPKP